MRYAALVIWSALVATAIFVGLFVGLTTVVRSAEPPRPEPICGWVLLHLCGEITLSNTAKKDYPEWMYFNPTLVSSVQNPASSPRGCVLLKASTGRSAYFAGTETEILSAVNRALAQVRSGECSAR
jgi:hypothetical protein